MSPSIKIPRLSETLGKVSWPRHCQRCGLTPLGCEAHELLLEVWREHDDSDRPEMIFVILCSDCSAQVIEKHPRLYGQLGKNEPAPGVMAICETCRYRDASRCTSPRARANGGAGLAFPPADVSMHLCRRGRGAKSDHIREWYREPDSCQGFEPREETQ